MISSSDMLYIEGYDVSTSVVALHQQQKLQRKDLDGRGERGNRAFQIVQLAQEIRRVIHCRLFCLFGAMVSIIHQLVKAHILDSWWPFVSGK